MKTPFSRQNTPQRNKRRPPKGWVRRRRQMRNRRRYRTRDSVTQANQQLKQFRQASILAVAITSLLLILFSAEDAIPAQDTQQTPDTALEDVPAEELTDEAVTPADTLLAPEDLGQAATNEAIGTIQNLWTGFYQNLPKLVVAIGAILFAWLLVHLVRLLLRKLIGNWPSSSAIIAITRISIWLLAIGIALSVLAGDIRALVGSLGLVGLALSWALQTPIESFTGWLLNSFQGYYRVGDRISVGDVFGDVYRIDFLTTTVWEIGAPDRGGFVHAEQPTGRLVTFPNSEILTGTVINLTRDFPFVWDELSVPVANESNIPLAMKVMEKVANQLLGTYMQEPAQSYTRILRKSNLDSNIAEAPQIFVSATDSWTDITIRYLVGARERRKWKSELQIRITEELKKPEYTNQIISAYPRQQVQFIQPDGIPTEIPVMGNNVANGNQS